jgi:hypothetical protein
VPLDFFDWLDELEMKLKPDEEIREDLDLRKDIRGRFRWNLNGEI